MTKLFNDRERYEKVLIVKPHDGRLVSAAYPPTMVEGAGGVALITGVAIADFDVSKDACDDVLIEIHLVGRVMWSWPLHDLARRWERVGHGSLVVAGNKIDIGSSWPGVKLDRAITVGPGELLTFVVKPERHERRAKPIYLQLIKSREAR